MIKGAMSLEERKVLCRFGEREGENGIISGYENDKNTLYEYMTFQRINKSIFKKIQFCLWKWCDIYLMLAHRKKKADLSSTLTYQKQTSQPNKNLHCISSPQAPISTQSCPQSQVLQSNNFRVASPLTMKDGTSLTWHQFYSGQGRNEVKASFPTHLTTHRLQAMAGAQITCKNTSGNTAY